MGSGEFTPGWSLPDQALLQTATQMLKAGQYEQLAELLAAGQAASEQSGDALAGQVLATARSISTMCNECQRDAEWHEQAFSDARKKEQDFKKQLQALLGLLDRQEGLKAAGDPVEALCAPTLSEDELPKRTRLLRLRQGLRALLARSFRSHLRGQAISKESTVGAAHLFPVQIEKPHQPVSPPLIIFCLGPFRAYQGDHLISDWKGLKCQSILKYLVSQYGRPVAKDILMDLFWPDAEPEAARRNLHQAVYSLRKTLHLEHSNLQYILFENDSYLLNPDIEIWLDFREFARHIEAGRRLEAMGNHREAMAEYSVSEGLYQGNFLEEDLYEDWAILQRDYFRNMYLESADRLAKYYLQQHEHNAAIALCQKILALDSCYEEAHRRLMRCYLALGQRHLAIRQYRTCADALRKELDLAPSKQTNALYDRIVSTT